MARAPHLFDFLRRLQYYSHKSLLSLAKQSTANSEKFPVNRFRPTRWLSAVCCHLASPHAQTRRPAALLAHPLDGGNNPSRNFNDGPVAIHFGKTSHAPVVLDDRCSQGFVGAHALFKDLFRIVRSEERRV